MLGYDIMNNYYKIAMQLLSEIESLSDNGEAIIVGGAVRDYILNRECDDIDISTNIDIDTICNHFDTYDIGKNKDFGVVVVKYHDFDFDVSNYRKDGVYSDGRHPDSVERVMDFYEDSLRRDFSINAMGMDKNHNIIDYHGGQEDLERGVIRCVGDARDRFREDYLRMLRAIRFATVLDFDIDNYDYQIIKDLHKHIADVSSERIWKEFWKMAGSDEFADGIYNMWNLGILEVIFPELDKMTQFPHYKEHHPEGNVWEHTFGVVQQLGDKSAVVKLGGLFHDIGKPVAYEWFPKKGKYHYIKHDILGLDVFDEVVRRIHIPKEIANEIRYCIKGHMRMHQFHKMRDSKCIYLMDSPYWKSLYDVSHADDRARLYCYDWHWWKKTDEKIERLQVILDGKKDRDAIVNGNFVMKILDVKGGKIVGDVLKKARAYVIDKKVDVTTDAGYAKIEKYVSTFK